MFREYIVPDFDGQYRWSYDMKANNNNDRLFYSLKWLLCFTVPFTVAILVTFSISNNGKILAIIIIMW